MHLITDERCTGYESYGHPERPARITGTVAKLREQGDIQLTWDKPVAVEDKAILLAHTEAHLKRITEALYDFDGDTAAHKDIDQHARRSVGGALRGLELAQKGELSFSLMRPPGHHATQDKAMGFCYFNQVAVAALQAQKQGFKKVAVYDFDVHHGNGTEAILLGKSDAAFYSIHQHPCYPGSGTKNLGENCFNYPVAPYTKREEWRKVLEKALADLGKFKPDLVCVSAGFDAYAHDPLAQGTLEEEDFHWMGESIRKLGLPTVNVLEGGYSNDLPKLIFAYLKGLTGK